MAANVSPSSPTVPDQRASLLPSPPDVELDVVVTVRDTDQPAVAYHSFADNQCDLGWWATMDQSKVFPVTITAHDTVTTDDGRTRTVGPVAFTVTGSASLYDPRTQTWKPGVQVPVMHAASGTLVFDPRSLTTAQFPWVGAMGLSVSASASYGVGLGRRFARTVVRVSGFIGYIN
jgi:hypothetical protein